MTDLADRQEWADELAHQAGIGDEAASRFAERTHAAYRERVSPAEAVSDIRQIESLLRLAQARDGTDRSRPTEPPGAGDPESTPLGGVHRFAVVIDEAAGTVRLRRFGLHAVELSSLLPVLESFGLVVIESVPTIVEAGGPQPAVHIDDIALRLADEGGPSRGLEADRERLVAALDAVADGDSEVDSLNRLVLAAGLRWDQVRIVRAYRRYRRQAGSTLADRQLDDPLVAFPEVAAGFVRCFESRFDPTLDEAERQEGVSAARAEVNAALAAVESFRDDQVLRDYFFLLDATVRTSYFLRTESGGVRPTLTLKFDSHSVPDLPLPHPDIEAFVHGPGVEGIHLRFGRVARGGIRWSERDDDFRTEILGLAEAQVRKNAIIVPTGAKGGFVVRTSADPSPAEVRAAYEGFIAALLDVTDNLVDGSVVTPAGVVAYDGEDPYFVVAADKGTSTFSDFANQLAIDRGFWLGDAFASGGSHGYDHKAMGITAKGAWVAVRRHFHQLDIDVQTEPIRVVGVGDMSGDVFGNGMLQSSAIELVAAFDHRHVFIDPEPDAARSYAERQRMAQLPRSSWDDYDRDAISAGGGVWSREVKSIPLSPAAQRALGVNAKELSPPDLISAILAAPVDLLWFGGIGTYVKATGENDAEVGDHANDAVRITSDRVRVRVIAEGGNLAVTHRARIQYSRRGGRINADFIDNAAGVATSDREVNLKILLVRAIEAGRLDPSERDDLLRSVEDHVAGEVLRQVDHSVAALNRSVPDSARDLDAYEALLRHLEAGGRVDRTVEDLPPAEEWQRRRQAGAGLIRPELAVLLAAAKSDLLAAIETSDVTGDPALLGAVEPYFPPEIVRRFGDLIPEHRLYPQLVATDLAGEIIDQMGVVWAHETAAELDVSLGEVAGAFWVARQMLEADTVWREIESTEGELTADADAAAHRAVAGGVADLARRYLLLAPATVSERIGGDEPAAAALRAADTWPERVGRLTSPLTREGVPTQQAERAAACVGLAGVADIARIARRVGSEPADVLGAWDAVASGAAVKRIVELVGRSARTGRWSTWEGRAIIDDASAWCASAVEAALRSDGGDVKSWLATRHAAFVRIDRLIAGVGRGSGDELPVAALAVRALPRDGLL